MLFATVSLAILCVLMSLLVLVPALREMVLQPAVEVLVAGVGHSVTLVKL